MYVIHVIFTVRVQQNVSEAAMHDKLKHTCTSFIFEIWNFNPECDESLSNV